MTESITREAIRKFFGLDLPISGGNGSSFDEAIKIEVTDSQMGVALEYEILDYIHQLGRVAYKLVVQELIKKGDRWYDKLKLEVSNDPDNYHNYYFEITSFYNPRED